MEEMYQAVPVPFRLGNSICDDPTIATQLEIAQFKLMREVADLISDSGKIISVGDEDCNCMNLQSDVSVITVLVPEQSREEGAPLLDMISEKKSNWVDGDDAILRESEEDDSLSLEGDQFLESSCSLSMASETSSLCGDDLLVVDTNAERVMPISNDIEKSSCNIKIIAETTSLQESIVEQDMMTDPIYVSVNIEEAVINGSTSKSSSVVLQSPLERGLSGTTVRSVFEMDYVPLWGFTSLCGRRPEMEDAVATVPRFLKIPIRLLIGDRMPNDTSKCLSHLTAHFFGVYDGHGGSQVSFSFLILCHYSFSGLFELSFIASILK